MSAITKTFITEAEYLEKERKALTKSEYYNGEVYAMAGASFDHNAITGALIGELYGFLKEKACKICPSDLRVNNQLNNFYTYPDVTIVCEKEEFLDEKFDTLLNPTILVEVLSPTTESYDRGDKFKLYRTIPSLKNYVLISSMEILVEIYTRLDDDKWALNVVNDIDGSIHISAIDYDLALNDVYSQVENFTKEN